MKNLILFTILLCIVGLAVAQTKVTDLSQPSLNDHVKRVTTYSFTFSNHEFPDSAENDEKTIETFNEKGWPLEEKNFDKNGLLDNSFSFKYIGD